MKAQVIEVTGYVPAIASLYVTKRNLDQARLEDIKYHVAVSTDRWGRVINPTKEFNEYMDKVIKYGVRFEHEKILEFIKIVVFMEGLHRGGQDDYDAHSKRMTIIRSSTRASKKSSDVPEISDYYKDKILPLFKIRDKLPQEIDKYVLTSWGYVRKDLIDNPDVLRGNVGLSCACDNISEMSFRDWRYVYHLRRKGTHAAPELQEAVEQVRKDLYNFCPQLGDMLGKVWCPADTNEGGFYYERNKVKYTPIK